MQNVPTSDEQRATIFMAALRDIKKRIKVVGNIHKITKAMKMVSAAKLRKSQQLMNERREYFKELSRIMSRLAGSIANCGNPFSKIRDVNKILFVVYTSDRGLCGGFNSAIIRNTEGEIAKIGKESVSLFLIGKKGLSYFKKKNYNIVGAINQNFNTTISATNEIKEKVAEFFIKNEFDEVYYIYPEFKTAITQKVTKKKLLPVELSGIQNAEFIIEPKERIAIDYLIDDYILWTLHLANAESIASEHGARMTSMDNATKNAEEMISSLTINYNRMRQAAITKELMEIINGSEALRE